MKAIEEHELRGLVSDLVLEWYSKSTDEGLDDASADDFRRLIRAAHVVADEAGLSLDRWVGAGRHAGLSWAEVGDVLGVSRQAAQQRFSRPDTLVHAAPKPTPRTPELICRTGMNAFNEVAAMQEEGRNGNELVGADFLKLFFAPRGRPWMNIRVTALRGSPVIKRYEEAGWTYALTWYPFHYFTRPEEEAT